MTGALPTPPWIKVERLLLVVSGSASAAFLPYWTNLLCAAHPGLRLQVVVTCSAERFVTRPSLVAAGAEAALLDVWPSADDATATHVELAEWAQTIAIYPASFHFLARLALGLGDSPALLASQCTTAPVLVAPSVPPGAIEGPVYQRHIAALEVRTNVVIAEPRPGRSITTGRNDAGLPPPLPTALMLITQQQRRPGAGDLGAISAPDGSAHLDRAGRP